MNCQYYCVLTFKYYIVSEYKIYLVFTQYPKVVNLKNTHVHVLSYKYVMQYLNIKYKYSSQMSVLKMKSIQIEYALKLNINVQNLANTFD